MLTLSPSWFLQTSRKWYATGQNQKGIFDSLIARPSCMVWCCSVLCCRAQCKPRARNCWANLEVAEKRVVQREEKEVCVYLKRNRGEEEGGKGIGGWGEMRGDEGEKEGRRDQGMEETVDKDERSMSLGELISLSLILQLIAICGNSLSLHFGNLIGP